MDGYMDEWMMLYRTCGLNLGGRNGRMGGGGWMVRSGMVEGRNGGEAVGYRHVHRFATNPLGCHRRPLRGYMQTPISIGGALGGCNA